MSGNFPESLTLDNNIGKQLVNNFYEVKLCHALTLKTVKYFQFNQCILICFLQPGYNTCFKGDVVEVGNLENMDKNENGIRWFETQYSANCRYTNTIRHLSEWTKDFKPDG